MIIIGFDPGSVSFGVGILKKENNRISYLHSEEIKLKDKDFYLRMKTLWRRLEAIYQQFPCHSAAIEEGYLGKNVRAMNVLAKVRGVVLGSLLGRDIPLTFYSPAAVKGAVTGSGAAAKTQVQKMMQILLNVKDKKLGADESDALAVAYCHMLSVK